MLEPSMFDVVYISIFPVHPIWNFFPLIGIVSDHPISSSLLLSGIYLFEFSIFVISMIENVFPFLLETCFSAALLSSTVWGREPWRRGVLTPNMLPIDWAQQISLLVFVCCIRDILYLYLTHIIGHVTDFHNRELALTPNVLPVSSFCMCMYMKHSHQMFYLWLRIFHCCKSCFQIFSSSSFSVTTKYLFGSKISPFHSSSTEQIFPSFLSDPSPIIGSACH